MSRPRPRAATVSNPPHQEEYRKRGLQPAVAEVPSMPDVLRTAERAVLPERVGIILQSMERSIGTAVAVVVVGTARGRIDRVVVAERVLAVLRNHTSQAMTVHLVGIPRQ